MGTITAKDGAMIYYKIGAKDQPWCALMDGR